MMEEPGIPSQKMLQMRGIALQSRGSDHRKGQVRHFANTSDAWFPYRQLHWHTYLGREEQIRGIGYAYKC